MNIKEILEQNNCYSEKLELDLLRHLEEMRNEILKQASKKILLCNGCGLGQPSMEECFNCFKEKLGI